MRVLILGAGGSARAVAYGLIEAGAPALTIAGRNARNLEALAHSLEPRAGQTAITTASWQDEGFAAACARADLIVNCTPIGMRHTETESESPLPRELVRPGVWVSDLVYNPLETPLLRLAAERGARPVAGLEMLVYQAAESVRLWTGREPPIDIMRKAASKALFGSD
jgi:shikimate dehydrogenase